jgi:hypothetical protein
MAKVGLQRSPMSRPSMELIMWQTICGLMDAVS